MSFLWGLVSVLIIVLTQTVAQSISDVPQCAEKAATSSISSTGCQLADIACICKDQSFINSLLPVVMSDCSAADLQKTIAFTQSLCDTAGITIAIPTSTSTAPSTGTPLPLSTSSVASDNQTYTASGTQLNKSTSTESSAITTASASPSTQSNASTGVAARYYNRYAWAGTWLAMIILLML